MNEFDSRSERLQSCLERIAAGDPLASTLATLGDDVDLAATTLLGARLAAVAPRQPRTAFRAALQAELQRDGRSPGRMGSGTLRRWVVRLSGAVVAVVLAFGSVVVASADSLPGGALYGVKLATEKARIVLADGASERALVHLSIAQRRLAEIHELLARGEAPPPSLVEAWAAAHDSARRSADEAGDVGIGRRADEALAVERAALGALVDVVGEDTRRTIERYAGERVSPEYDDRASSEAVPTPKPPAIASSTAVGVATVIPSSGSPRRTPGHPAATATPAGSAGPLAPTPLPPSDERPARDGGKPEAPTGVAPAADTPLPPEATDRPMGTAAARLTERSFELTAEPTATATPFSHWPWPWPRWPTAEPTQSIGPGSGASPAVPTSESPEP